MTEAMPFLQKTILLSYDPRPFGRGIVFCCKMGVEPSTGGLTRGKFFDRRQWRM